MTTATKTRAKSRRRTARDSKPGVTRVASVRENDDARTWLRANGYTDIADRIDQLLAEWKAKGLQTRRNWWVVLAGGSGGRPYSIYGEVFPVLVAAQKRQGKTVTENAIRRTAREVAPAVRVNRRWPAKRELL